jgi:hypothetical protein
VRIQDVKQRGNKFIEKKWAPMINDTKWRTKTKGIHEEIKRSKYSDELGRYKD